MIAALPISREPGVAKLITAPGIAGVQQIDLAGGRIANRRVVQAGWRLGAVVGE